MLQSVDPSGNLKTEIQSTASLPNSMEIQPAITPRMQIGQTTTQATQAITETTQMQSRQTAIQVTQAANLAQGPAINRPHTVDQGITQQTASQELGRPGRIQDGATTSINNPVPNQEGGRANESDVGMSIEVEGNRDTEGERTGNTVEHEDSFMDKDNEPTVTSMQSDKNERLQIKLEQLQELLAAKSTKAKELLISKPIDRPRRAAGDWKDGPARFKALCLQALCSKADPWVTAHKTSLKQALRQEGRKESVETSIYAEIDNLEQPGVLKAVLYRDIPKHAHKDIINAFMFHKKI